MRLSKEKIKEVLGIDTEDDFSYVEIVPEKQYKSRQQSNTFHALLGCFWKSGCSSFRTYNEMRNYYKREAHLCEVSFENYLDEESKQMIWKAVNILPLKPDMKREMVELLKGRIIKWHSFSECSKEMASIAIDKLISDMWEARVDDSPQSKKFKEILDGFRNQIR